MCALNAGVHNHVTMFARDEEPEPIALVAFVGPGIYVEGLEVAERLLDQRCIDILPEYLAPGLRDWNKSSESP